MRQADSKYLHQHTVMGESSKEGTHGAQSVLNVGGACPHFTEAETEAQEHSDCPMVSPVGQRARIQARSVLIPAQTTTILHNHVAESPRKDQFTEQCIFFCEFI